MDFSIKWFGGIYWIQLCASLSIDSNDKKFLTLYVNLLLRKAIAFHSLGNNESYDIFTVALQNTYGERKKHIAKVIKNQYGIDHHLARDI